MPAKILELHFPLGGLNKAASFQKQPPYTSPSLSNVRPSETFTGRDRGGSRPGISKSLAAQLGGGNPVRSLSAVTWISSGVPVLQGMAVANGVLSRETGGNWAAVGGALTLASDILMAPAEHLQKLYYPDRSTTALASGSDGVITGTNTFDSATYSDWSILSIDTDDHILHLLNATTGATIGQYVISSIAAGTLGIAGSPADATGLGFRIERSPKVYTPSTNTLARWAATTGHVPPSCKIVWRWRDRIMLAGDPYAPHLVYASRAGDPLDFDYSQDDEIAAFSLQGADAGAIGDIITAGFAHSDNCSIVGCRNSLWIISGDPASGGRVSAISETIGMVDQRSWCYTPSGWLFFLSLDGLYAMPPGCGNDRPLNVSRGTIPELLLAVDNTTHTVLMAYDLRDQGIHLFVTPNSGGAAGTHYFITTDSEGGSPRARFFPCEYPYTMEPLSLFSRRDSTNANSAVWLGCRDGYTRYHSDSQTTDDGTAISSSVYFGPLSLGGSGYHDGLLKELVAKLSTSSGTVAWSVHVGQTAQAAFEAAAFGITGSWATAGLNATVRPRARGAAACIKLTSTARWAMESITAVIERMGVQRL